MEFDHQKIIAELERNTGIIYGLLDGTSEDEYHFRYEVDKWTLLEVICHLRDEEVEDFRTRVASVLKDPNEALPSIDPVGWVTSRKYNDQPFEAVLNDWEAEREKSLNWLKSLDSPSWDNAFMHPKFGAMSARLFLCNWLSHDYHHIRQIITIKRAFLIHSSGEDLRYAGKW